jgi:hypothetical protein
MVVMVMMVMLIYNGDVNDGGGSIADGNNGDAFNDCNQEGW